MKNKVIMRFWFNSLRHRYKFLIAGIIACMLVMTAIQFGIMEKIFISSAQRSMITAVDKIEELFSDQENFNRNIAECEAAHNIYVEIYKPRDVLVYTTSSNDWIYDTNISVSDVLKPRIMKILSHNDIGKNSYIETRQEYYATAKYIVYARTYPDSAIEVYTSLDSLTSNADTASLTLFWMSAVFLLLIVLIIIFYEKNIIHPLERINEVTKRIAKMDFTESCGSSKIKELEELSSNINALTASLDIALKDLQDKNRKLEHDIEKEHKLEETRKQFIANASHELKTPISIIQGYAEGLKYSVTEGSPEEYCEIIIDETEKMNSLVMRLLEITRYDSGVYSAQYEAFNIRELLDSYISSRRKAFDEKEIEYICDIEPDFIGYGDKEFVCQIFGNYISNAVSHCDFEKKITVRCKQNENVYTVSVINTGHPIAQEDLPNIWQSFYRADKAHSRAEGRFGLGLSIVASLQNILGQKYGVKNGENEVEFWFNIQKA